MYYRPTIYYLLLLNLKFENFRFTVFARAKKLFFILFFFVFVVFFFGDFVYRLRVAIFELRRQNLNCGSGSRRVRSLLKMGYVGQGQGHIFEVERSNSSLEVAICERRCRNLECTSVWRRMRVPLKIGHVGQGQGHVFKVERSISC